MATQDSGPKRAFPVTNDSGRYDYGMTLALLRNRPQTARIVSVGRIPSQPARRGMQSKVVAVLNIDAITAEAAKDLREENDAFRAGKHKALSDLANYVSLFY